MGSEARSAYPGYHDARTGRLRGHAPTATGTGYREGAHHNALRPGRGLRSGEGPEADMLRAAVNATLEKNATMLTPEKANSVLDDYGLGMFGRFLNYTEASDLSLLVKGH